jgi:hypothetical protein
VRFAACQRLYMSRGKYSEKGTLELARELLKCSQRLERMLIANGLSDPFWWLLRKTGLVKAHMLRKGPALAGELGLRYWGVLRELFRRAGMEERLVPEATVAVWQAVLDQMRGAIDYRAFSAIVWHAAESHAGYHQPAIKPKLMLRQFVDEMPEGDERGAIRVLAYGQVGTEPPGREVLQLLSSGYGLLHIQLIMHIHELDVLTDNLLSAEFIQQIGSSYVQYEEWLFCA